MARSGQWATFFLEGEMFALPVDVVQEVLMQQELTPVPHAPPYMIGLLNLRGQIMPAIDLRRRLGFAPHATGADLKQLVLKSSEGTFSVLVDEIGDVLELPDDGWRAPPETLSESHRHSVLAVYPVAHHLVLAVQADHLGFAEEA
jgi:purine-binding chemotaxis protein CheW